MTIGATLASFAARKPDATAIICDDVVVTWSALKEAVDAIVVDLENRCAPDATVALVVRNSPIFAAFFLACAVSGRAAAVIDAAWPSARIGDALETLHPSLLVADRAIDGIDAMIVDPRAQLPSGAPPCEVRDIDPEAAFYVGFTSGSTGRPKGYRRSHRSWLASFEGDRIEFGMTEDDVVLAPGSMSHSLFLYALIHGLQIGAAVLMSAAFHPVRALRVGRQHGATVAYAAPTQWRMMIEADQPSLPDLRWALSSGAKWFAGSATEIRKIAPSARFAEFYGASELSFVAVRKADEGCPDASVGRPFSGVAITIRNEDGARLGPGEIGRVFVSSPYLFSGYVGDDSAIARHDGEMSVGDVGFLDEAGRLYLVGRGDRMIVSSGKNIFAEEIESALECAPGIRAAAVFGAADAVRGQAIVALVLPEHGLSPRRDEVIRSLRERLPVSFIPRVIAVPSEWRWTRSGKTDFSGMRAVWESGAWSKLA